MAYICVDDDSLGLHAGLTLQRQLRDRRLPVVIRMAEDNGLAKLLENRKNHRGSFRNLFAFGYLDRTCTPELLNDTPGDILARAAYEEYLQRRRKVADPAMVAALLPWEKLDKEHRKANTGWVDRIHWLLKESGYEIAPISDWDIPLMKFSPDEVERMARLGRDLWRPDCAVPFDPRFWGSPPDFGDKQAGGWARAVAAKTSPDLVSWEALPDAEKEQARMWVTGIPSFLPPSPGGRRGQGDEGEDS